VLDQLKVVRENPEALQLVITDARERLPHEDVI